MPNILFAMDSFKGSLSSAEVADFLAEGLQLEAGPSVTVRKVPLGDGGEGTLDAIMMGRSGQVRLVRVPDADGRPTHARLWTSGDLAWLEAADVVGLPRAVGQDPTVRSTYGLGELVLQAVGEGARKIILGCGGSSTVDAGIGLLQAMGAAFEPEPPAFPFALNHVTWQDVERIDLAPAVAALRGATLVAAVDVQNPLEGPGGAAVYAPQKGLPRFRLPQVVATFDRVADLMSRAGAPVKCVPGAGAAGGLPAAVMALSGEIADGFGLVSSVVGLQSALEWADVVVTGEGSLDATTWHGKLVSRVIQSSPGGKARTIVVAGQAKQEAVNAAMEMGASAVFTLVSAGGDDCRDAIASPGPRLRAVGRQLARLLRPLPCAEQP